MIKGLEARLGRELAGGGIGAEGLEGRKGWADMVDVLDGMDGREIGWVAAGGFFDGIRRKRA